MTQTTAAKSKILVEAGTNELEIITFFLQWIDPSSGKSTKTYYGINAAKVRELVAMPEEITVTPDSPHCVEGVFLLRNHTIPLTDLCKWFDYEPDRSEEALAKWVVVVAEINGKSFGFTTHGVDKVHRVSWTKILSPPEILADNQSITGICLMDEHLIQMVDFEKITAKIDPSMDLENATVNEPMNQLVDDKDKVVVIAEDSATIRQQLQRTLELAGLNVSIHNDGQAAWEFLEKHRQDDTLDQTVLAIITDIEMPRMDGHHLCLKVKKEDAYKNIPVILFSSMISDGLRNKGKMVGADDQVTKPELTTLFERLQACLDKRKK